MAHYRNAWLVPSCNLLYNSSYYILRVTYECPVILCYHLHFDIICIIMKKNSFHRQTTGKNYSGRFVCKCSIFFVKENVLRK